MAQIVGERSSFTLSINLCRPPPQGVVLKRRHFQHALLSGSESAKRVGSKYDMENPGTTELPLMSKVDPVVKPVSSNSEEQTLYKNPKHLLSVPRKYRMRDQYGNHLTRKKMAKALLPQMEGCTKLTLNARSLKLGTLNIFSGPVTFSVDYIEIANEVQIEALELTSCEWCRGHAALFLKMTDTARWHLREKLAIFTDENEQNGCQSKNQGEKHLLIVLESVPTVLEKTTLEEIFTEIGRIKNLSNFLVRLTREEATERLMAYNNFQKSEVTTLSVLDSEDDDNLKECPSSHSELVKTLVMYPPPPAKGGFSITEEDLSCLDEGKFLNDVIIDFYLKYLVCEKLQKEAANRCHVFSSFFYKSLTQNDLKEDPDITSLSIQQRRHNRVRTWTRHLDLFKKDFIFVPINQLSHWYLAIICFPDQASHRSIMDSFKNKNEENSIVFTPSSPFSNPMSLFYRLQPSEQVFKWSVSEGELDEGFCFVSDDDLDDKFQYNLTSKNGFKMSDSSSKAPCILIMDSLSCGSNATVVKVLQEYLEMEWQVRKGSLWNFGKRAMSGWSVQVPQQDNHTDCGVYVLQYVESFITDPPKTFHPAMDLSDWFPQRLVKKKRERIKQLIFRLHCQQQAEVGE